MILVCGEALIDLTAEPRGYHTNPLFVARPGGSPANVAVALGRLGTPVAFLGRISRDPLGEHIRRHLRASGVDLGLVRATDDPTTIVTVTMDAAGEPSYGFYMTDTASATITPDDVPDPLPAEVAAIHVGSISIVMEPTASTLEALVVRESHRRVIVLDPNVRPTLIADREAYRLRLRDWLATAHIVKASEADLAWLEPGRDPAAVAEEWRQLGPALVIVTSGERGAIAVSGDGAVHVDAPDVRVADTVGAGDAFTAGLLHALSDSGSLTPGDIGLLPPATLHHALGVAVAVAADNCTRFGADPTWANHRTVRT